MTKWEVGKRHAGNKFLNKRFLQSHPLVNGNSPHNYQVTDHQRYTPLKAANSKYGYFMILNEFTVVAFFNKGSILCYLTGVDLLD